MKYTVFTLLLLGTSILGIGCQSVLNTQEEDSINGNESIEIQTEQSDNIESTEGDDNDDEVEDEISDTNDSTNSVQLNEDDSTTESEAVTVEATYGGQEEVTAENCIDDECLQFEEIVVSALDDEVVNAMNRALDDEYKALETYNQVIDAYGTVTPFSNIRRAEERHIAALESLYEKYGYDIPNNPYMTMDLLTVDSMTEACEIGVEAEIDNAALYRDELLPAVEEYEDITRVFTNLMNASQNNHLPAFERCADGESGNGFSNGNGSRNSN